MRDKLGREPVEDLRIDFEDGYGPRSDEEEDRAVEAAARDLRAELGAGAAPPGTGIRFKSFERPTRRRGLRTLALFVATLTDGGPLPDGFVVTLPKVTSVDQVEALVHAAGRLEAQLGLAAESLRFELQIETPQSILGPDGTALVARMVHASGGRCTGLHYGTYDYSASCGIAAAQQSLEHPVADHAKAVMQAAAAGTGVRLSDGSTNVLPVGPPEAVRAAWSNHLRLVRRSLERGYYQGWDLHPAQLPTRYAATFAFYRRGLGRRGDAAARLRRAAGLRDPRRAGHRPRAGRLRAPRARLRGRVGERGHRRERSRHGDAGGPRAPHHREGEAEQMGIVLGANRYGKAECRVVRIVRDTTRHEIHDLTVSTSLRGDFTAAHIDGDQSQVLPTDTQKNTAFAYAKQHGVTSSGGLRARPGPAPAGGDARRERRPGPGRGARLGPDPGRRRRPRPRVRPSRWRGPHHRGRPHRGGGPRRSPG